jgi:inositol 1,4,5-triphosphate receptor type 1
MIDRYWSYDTLQSFVRLLLAMTQGNRMKDALKVLFEIDNLKELLKISKDIFQQRIFKKKRTIVLD